jgi:hypothetical protein
VRNGSKSYFHNAIRKYGKEDFKWEILKENANLDDEKRLISEHKTHDEGYNQTEGGEGTIGNIRSDETRKKLSEAAKKPRSEFFKQRAKEVANSPEGREQRRKQNLGRVFSEETKEKLRIANTGKTLNEEAKAKISAAVNNRSPELIEKIRRSQLNSDKMLRKVVVPVNVLSEEYYTTFKCNMSAMSRHYGVAANSLKKKLKKARLFDTTPYKQKISRLAKKCVLQGF